MSPALTERQERMIAALRQLGPAPVICRDLAAATGMTSDSAALVLRSLRRRGLVSLGFQGDLYGYSLEER